MPRAHAATDCSPTDPARPRRTVATACHRGKVSPSRRFGGSNQTDSKAPRSGRPPPSRLPSEPPVAKKADLEASFRECSARCAEATRAEANGDFAVVLERAASTLPRLREYIAYLRRYQQVEAPRLPSVDLILHYAPPMFARRSLDAVGAWLAEATRAERRLYPDLPGRLETARRRLALAARVWPSWRPAAPGTGVPGDAAEVAQLLDFWTRYGVAVGCPDTSPRRSHH